MKQHVALSFLFVFFAFMASTVPLLAQPCTPTIEARSASVERTKTGTAEFQQSSPPEVKIYKTTTYWVNKNYDAWSSDPVELLETSYWIHTVQQDTADPDNYSPGNGQAFGCENVTPQISSGYNGETGFYSSITYRGVTEEDDCSTSMDSTGNWEDPECASLVFLTCSPDPEDITTTETPISYRSSWNTELHTATEETSTDTYCYGYEETDLSNEYTTSDLISKLSSDLGSEAYSSWGEGSTTASFHLSSSQVCGSASKFQARITMDAPPGPTYTVVYTLRTNDNGPITSHQFTQQLSYDSVNFIYTYTLPEIIPPHPEMDIDLIDVALVMDCPCTDYFTPNEWFETGWGPGALFSNLVYCKTCKLAGKTPIPQYMLDNYDYYYPFVGTAYNCLAWTLGITDRWVWKEADADANGYLTTTELDAYYAYNYVYPFMVDYYGPGTSNIQHVALNSNGLGADCRSTSKLGQTYRVAHEPHGIEGPAYGTIVGQNQ